MTDTLLEQIKADREIGTPGPWVFELVSIEDSMMGEEGEWNISAPGHDMLFGNCPYYPYVSENMVDGRRTGRVPDLEARILRDAETIKALVKALAPFANVPTHGLSGGPLVLAVPGYEDGSEGSDLPRTPNWPGHIPHEAFTLARAAFRAAQESKDE